MSRIQTNWRVKFLVVLSFIFVSHYLLGNQEQLVGRIFTLELMYFPMGKMWFMFSSIVSGNVKLFSPTASNGVITQSENLHAR
jgi:hypothetical protein